MQNNRNLKLLTRPHVQAFLYEEFGTLEFYVRQTSVLARSITSAIIFKSNAKKEKEGAFVTVELNARMANYYGRLLQISRRNYFFEDLFKEKFFSFVDALTSVGIQKTKAVDIFCKHYKIDDDMISQGVLYRIYNKHKANRKKIEKNGYVSVLSKIN